MSASVPTMPEWVTALEAAVLTGASEIVVLDAVRSGRLQANPLSMGKGSSGVLLVRLRDVQALVEETSRPAAPEAVAPTAPPVPPSEPTVSALPLSEPTVSALPPSAPTVAGPPVTAPAPSGFAPFSTPVTPAPTATSPSAGPTGIWGERKAPPQPAPEVPAPAKDERPRLRNPKTLAAAILALALLAAAVYVARPGGGGNDRPRVAGSLGAAPPSVVWMIPTAHGNQIAVVALPKSGPAIAIAVPSESHVVLPAGDISTVGVSADSGPRAQAVAQNVLLKRIGHYLVTTPASFAKLVDALGGIQVQTEATFTFGGHRIDSGSITMKGAMAVAYLSQAGTNDVTGRWEDLLAGVLDAAHESSAWATVGTSDDPVVVSRLLAASTGATVLEMPTEPASGGGVEPDRNALSAMLPRFGQSLGTLVRVVVVNGSGAPGLGTLIDGKLAPYGFSVVISENASHFDVKRTTVVATGESNRSAAEVAAKILGVKNVKISDQPTSLADVTIVVGKDLHT